MANAIAPDNGLRKHAYVPQETRSRAFRSMSADWRSCKISATSPQLPIDQAPGQMDSASYRQLAAFRAPSRPRFRE